MSSHSNPGAAETKEQQEDDFDLSIGDLFMIKDYKEEKFGFGSSVVSAKVSVASCTDHDLTGQIIWPGTTILGHFLDSFGKRILDGKSCIELGAGAGVTGLLAGQFASSLVLTDHNDEVLSLLEQNLELNRPRFTHMSSAASSSVAKLEWSDKLPAELDKACPGGFDVVIGSDIVYSCNAADALTKTMKELLLTKSSSMCFLSFIKRWNNVNQWFASSAEKTGLSLQAVPLEWFMPEGVDVSDAVMYLINLKDRALSEQELKAMLFGQEPEQ